MPCGSAPERAFVALVHAYHPSLLANGPSCYCSHAVAEEVVQETWLGVLKGIDRFEGRSSLKTWIFSILLHRAKTRARSEGRTIPFSARWEASSEPDDENGGEGWVHGRWPSPVRSWGATAEEQVLAGEFDGCLREAIGALPPHQKEVITLRDVEGWTSGEVCNVLGLTETNQRVLLHRARLRVRRALEEQLGRRAL